jgi:hypothetical protein
MLQSRFLRLAVMTAIAAAVPFVVPVAADELTDVYARIIANPVDTELNLQYALLAEGRGEYRKALAAYERVLINDPANQAGKDGLQRVRRIIEPAVTLTTLEAGAVGESNPLHSADPSEIEGDVFAFARARIRDERPLDTYRWRTILGVYGELHASETQLNYGNVDVETGPLIDLAGTMMAFRPALGAGAAYFDGRFYYWDVNASATLEGYLQGAHQWVKLRGGYRDFDPSFTTTSGFYADLTGRLALQNIIHDDDVFSISPKLRWSDIDGLPQDGGDEFAPGLYVEAGATFEYSKVINEGLTAALNFRLNQRWYEDIGGGPREDFLLSPGAAIVFTGALGPQADIKLDYRYELNNSNDSDHDWDNHVIKLGVSIRR